MLINKWSAAILLVGGLSMTSLQADEIKNHSIGLTSSATTISVDGYEDDGLSGLGLTYTGTFSDSGARQWAGRVTYASQEHDDLSALKSAALDANILWGGNINQVGFKWYVGGGLFNEKWSLGSSSLTHNGMQLGGGIGYNWRPVSLDFWINLRNGGAYDFGGGQR